MIGKIESYDEKTQTGVIQAEGQYYGFHRDDWSEKLSPRLESKVLFEDKGDTASMVTLIGKYVEHKEAVKSRNKAAFLGMLLGIVGAHRWYLGFYKIALIQMTVTAFTLGFGVLWPFVEGFLIYTGRINEDAEGRPLK